MKNIQLVARFKIHSGKAEVYGDLSEKLSKALGGMDIQKYTFYKGNNS